MHTVWEWLPWSQDIENLFPLLFKKFLVISGRHCVVKRVLWCLILGSLFKFPMSTFVFLIREPHPSRQRWKGEGGYFMDTCKVYLQWLTVAMAPHIGCTSNTYYIVFLYNTEIEVDQCNLLLLFSRVLQFYLCIFLQILPVMLPRPNRRLMAWNLNLFDIL